MVHNFGKLYHSVRGRNKLDSLDVEFACLHPVTIENEGLPFFVLMASNHKTAWVPASGVIGEGVPLSDDFLLWLGWCNWQYSAICTYFHNQMGASFLSQLLQRQILIFRLQIEEMTPEQRATFHWGSHWWSLLMPKRGLWTSISNWQILKHFFWCSVRRRGKPLEDSWHQRHQCSCWGSGPTKSSMLELVTMVSAPNDFEEAEGRIKNKCPVENGFSLCDLLVGLLYSASW